MISNILNKAIGGLDVLQKHKNIYTAIVHTNQPLQTPLSDFEMQIIKMTAETPKFPLDFEFFTFVKMYCDAEFTTGNQILQFPDVSLPQMFSERPDIRKIKQQNNLIRTNFVISKKLNTQQIQNHPFFSIPYYKNYITINDNIDKNLFSNPKFSANNIQAPQFESFGKAASYFQTLLNSSDRIFYDIGPQYLHQVMDKLDLYVITIYSGELNDKFKVGKMPSFIEVQKNLKLTYISEIFGQYQGNIQFFVFEK